MGNSAQMKHVQGAVSIPKCVIPLKMEVTLKHKAPKFSKFCKDDTTANVTVRTLQVG